MKTSKILIVAIIVTGLILISALGVGLYVANEIKNKTESINQINKENIDYHVMMIINKNDETYSDRFFKGVSQSSNELRIAIEEILIEDDDYINEVVDRLDMAIYSKVDGIIVHVYEDARIIDKINQASDMGIPVITLNENLHNSKRISFSGNNKYSIGLNVGKTIASITSGRGQIAVVDSIDYTFNETEETNMLNLGLKTAISDYADLDVRLTRYTEQGVLSAETIATEILDDYETIDSIYCSDSQSTLGIIQVLIDRNRVNDFTVIGFGDDAEILNYIKSGVIAATVVTDDEAIGKEAVIAFFDHTTKRLARSESQPSIMVIDKSNVQAYIEDKESGHED